jgi:hypothetical protein
MEQALKFLLVLVVLAGILIGSNLLMLGMLRGSRGFKWDGLKGWNRKIISPGPKNTHGEDNYEELSRLTQALKDQQNRVNEEKKD